MMQSQNTFSNDLESMQKYRISDWKYYLTWL